MRVQRADPTVRELARRASRLSILTFRVEVRPSAVQTKARCDVVLAVGVFSIPHRPVDPSSIRQRNVRWCTCTGYQQIVPNIIPAVYCRASPERNAIPLAATVPHKSDDPCHGTSVTTGPSGDHVNRAGW